MELIDGKIEYISNGEIVRIDDVENGILASSDCENPDNGHCDDDYPLMNECSYDGIQDCTQHSIYEEMNALEKLACAAEGTICILEEAAACIIDNC